MRLRNLERRPRAVGGLEAELVERRLQRLRVARARERRAADGVDVGALPAERLLPQRRLGGGRDLRRARVVPGQHPALMSVILPSLTVTRTWTGPYCVSIASPVAVPEPEPEPLLPLDDALALFVVAVAGAAGGGWGAGGPGRAA